MVPEPVTDLLAVTERVAPEWFRRLAYGVIGDAAVAPSEVETIVERCASSLTAELDALLSLDVEAQNANPLALFRAATEPLAAYLNGLGYPARKRDRFEIDRFPGDIYGFAPATWADIHPDLAPAGLAWGAWKAMTIMARHRTDGAAGPSGDSNRP